MTKCGQSPRLSHAEAPSMSAADAAKPLSSPLRSVAETKAVGRGGARRTGHQHRLSPEQPADPFVGASGVALGWVTAQELAQASIQSTSSSKLPSVPSEMMMPTSLTRPGPAPGWSAAGECWAVWATETVWVSWAVWSWQQSPSSMRLLPPCCHRAQQQRMRKRPAVR